MKLQGIFLSVATPFDHTGSIWEIKLQHNVGKWNRTGLSGYAACAAVGEGACLSSEEKVRVWKCVAECAAPEKLLIAAVDMPGVRETVELIGRAAALGYKAALVRPPYQDTATRSIYVCAVADNAEIPVVADCAEALPHPNIIARVEARIEKAEGQVLASCAAGVGSSLAAGASGAVLALANAIPYAMLSIWEAHRSRETEAALDWQNRIARASELIAKKYGVPGLKYAMDLNGYYGGPPRLPLTVITPEARHQIEQAFDGIKG